jgi:RHS repeat-associated protein
LTNNPNPDKFDGKPPAYEPEKVMLASLGTIRSILLHSVVGQTTGGQKIFYFVNDHLGTPQKLIDENGDVVWSADSEPFGKADVYINAYANNFRFMGQYYDEESGLHYNYHRYYDPKLGRYLTPDPIGLAGGINLFAYAGNDPVNATDPFGLFDWKDYSRSISPNGGVPVGIDPVAVPWGDFRKAVRRWLNLVWTDTGDTCKEVMDNFDPFLNATEKIFGGIGKAGEETWNALVYNQELHRGTIFGFKAAGRVNLEAADFVYHDIRNTLISTYAGGLIHFPAAGSHAVGMSITAINSTVNVIHFQEVARNVSSDIMTIRKNVFAK